MDAKRDPPAVSPANQPTHANATLCRAIGVDVHRESLWTMMLPCASFAALSTAPVGQRRRCWTSCDFNLHGLFGPRKRSQAERCSHRHETLATAKAGDRVLDANQLALRTS
mmetsp:Transcript_10951/g.28272  ORF Transcript_10951/g.28272 Transcript_10951/m.28272 type:complete len:111 (-) Transcript_10951:509-841(-)